MIPAVLHLGAGKCGSSALQAALSNNPTLETTTGSVWHYVGLNAKGMLLTGKRVTRTACAAPQGYVSSATAGLLAALPDTALESVALQLHELAGDRGSVVFSKEGWLNESAVFRDSRLLISLQLAVTVVVYVRPPVDWINSAWWQWGAWADISFDLWLKRTLQSVRWYNLIRPWQDMEGVQQVVVRLLPADIVADFCRLIDVPALETSRNNTSLPGPVLRFFQHQRQLRPGPHHSAIDFILSRHLKGVEGGTPWVLKPEDVELIIRETRENNLGLLTLLDEESQGMMQADPRWWDAAAYRDRVSEPPEPQSLAADQVELLAAQAMQAVADLDAENRKLRRELLLLQPQA